MAKKGQWIYYWNSASETHRVKFIRWVRMRMHTGGDDTNKLGVGAIVWSSWLFSQPLINRRQRHGLRSGYYVLRPYWELYRKNPYVCGSRQSVPKVRRPKLKDVKRSIR